MLLFYIPFMKILESIHYTISGDKTIAQSGA